MGSCGPRIRRGRRAGDARVDDSLDFVVLAEGRDDRVVISVAVAEDEQVEGAVLGDQVPDCLRGSFHGRRFVIASVKDEVVAAGHHDNATKAGADIHDADEDGIGQWLERKGMNGDAEDERAGEEVFSHGIDLVVVDMGCEA